MRIYLQLVLAVVFLPSLGGCGSSYYVQVVDQYGDPVEGAEITYSTLSGNAYFFNREGHRAVTDSNGMARLLAGKTNRVFEIQKKGYQVDIRRQVIHRFKSGSTISERKLKEHGRSNPFKILAWKRGAEPRLITARGRLKIVNDSRDCRLNLLSTAGGSIDLIIKNDLRWKQVTGRYPYHLDGWTSSLRLSGGKIKRTNDFFMNEADPDGYMEEVIISNEDGDRHTFFVRSDNGSIYGGGILEYDPASVPVKDSAESSTEGEINLQFWFNTDGSRNIMRGEDAGWFGLDIVRGGGRLNCEKDRKL
jgi:hypothetical protein